MGNYDCDQNNQKQSNLVKSSMECNEQRLFHQYPRCGTCINLLSWTLFAGLLVSSMYLWRDYVHAVLIWTEHQPDYLVILIFLLLYTLVSLPLVWGYIVVNIACGYIFGIIHGTLVTLVTATMATLIAHLFIKAFLANLVQRWLNSSDSMRSLYIVLSGPKSFRLVALSRFTPVPFGLQNAVFAVSNLSTGRYILASVIGCLPSQILNSYLGSTLRSMEEVMYSEETKKTGYIVLMSQVVMMCVVAVFVIRRARLELSRTMVAQEVEAQKQDLEKGNSEGVVLEM